MVSVVVPTYNAARYLPSLLQKLREQTQEHELIIIDSESTDDTKRIVKQTNSQLIQIKKSEFNHGRTRNIGLKAAQNETVIFMTQDALPVSANALEILVASLNSHSNIAMAYGRQLPYPETKIFGRLARLTNYPAQSVLKTKAMIPFMGIKTCSCSNSFAAYKKSELMAVGGFPTTTILGEDVSVAAKFILQDKTVAYSAEAEVYHSHDYTVLEEFKRYFDIGVFHNDQQLILNEFSQSESEGFKYVIDEWKYLIGHRRFNLIPAQLVRTVAKYTGYRLGRWEEYLPVYLKRKLSMHTYFWK